MDQYQSYIHLSRYAHWLEDKQRRETWPETVTRFTDFWLNKQLITPDEAKMLNKAIVNQEVVPSMRCLMTAGAALDRDNIAGYNCAYLALDNVRAFDEALFVLMCGTGVGYSCEADEISQLPVVAEELHDTDTVIRVADSKIGWAKSLKELVSLLYAGQVPRWDVSAVRPAGAKLRTFGGRASGPDPLVSLFEYAVALFRGAAGRRLTTIECSDLVCKIADVVVVGGVRRSALICLSDLNDDRMRHAKSGNWQEVAPHRRLANISAVYDERPDFATFNAEWGALYASGSGERGVFSRSASRNQAALNGRRDPNFKFGTNPCSEIILRSNQFCNLSEVIIRPDDSVADLKRKVRLAAILGTLQSTLTNFRYLRKVWERNTAEERLLGVSMTGIMDHPILQDPYNPKLPKILETLRDEAVQTNKDWAERLGIPQSTAVTCVKPSGTVSQLADTASGIHTRNARFYIRRVRGDKKDPLSVFLKDQGVPCEDDVWSDSTYVFSFPKKSPPEAILDQTAQEALDTWMIYQKHWCEHKPSATVTYTDNEFLGVGNWLWNNLDDVSGLSFLPRDESGTVYPQLPEEGVDEAAYNALVDIMPEIDYKAFGTYESEDNTVGSQELACTAGGCEI